MLKDTRIPFHVSGYKAKMFMMMSSNGNIFHVIGLLWRESVVHRWIHLKRTSDAELCYFLWSAPEQTSVLFTYVPYSYVHICGTHNPHFIYKGNGSLIVYLYRLSVSRLFTYVIIYMNYQYKIGRKWDIQPEHSLLDTNLQFCRDYLNLLSWNMNDIQFSEYTCKEDGVCPVAV